MLRRGLAEYGSPSFRGRRRPDRSIGGGGVGGGSGESETERLGEAAAAGGGCATLDFLTWTEDGSSEDTCFSRERIYGNTKGQKEFLFMTFSG